MQTTFRVVQADGRDTIFISGPINEDAEVQLSKLNEGLGDNITINFKGVTFINSLGVRAWINFIREIEGRNLIFEECTPEIVNQINMIPNFKGGAQIKSVYGTYFCNSCSETQSFLFEDGSTLPTTEDIEIPEVKCEHCSSDDTEFEEVEDAFFAFSIAG